MTVQDPSTENAQELSRQILGFPKRKSHRYTRPHAPSKKEWIQDTVLTEEAELRDPKKIRITLLIIQPI